MSLHSSHKRILIVEDQGPIAKLWESKFHRAGFDVHVTQDGQAAMEEMQKQPFDVVLLDLYMPRKDGFEVLREKETTLNGKTPTYVVTSSTSEDDLEQATALGARRAYLKYRISPNEIVSTICEELKG